MIATHTDVVADAIERARFRFADEDALQRGILKALQAAGLRPQREVRLDSRNRIDLLVGDVGVEVKVAGTKEEVRRQCVRYLLAPQIGGLVLVTTRAAHAGLRPHGPASSKPFRLVQLAGASL